MIVGILAIQGGFALHQEKFSELGVKTRLVVQAQDLEGVAGLVLPGGESSTMVKNTSARLWKEIKAFSQDHPLWGVCAGSILLADHIKNSTQPSFGVMDMSIQRNAYGSQNDSFIADIKVMLSEETKVECIFIRAPRIFKVDKTVNVLATYNADPVMVEQTPHIATTFHPELAEGVEFYEYFIGKISRN